MVAQWEATSCVELHRCLLMMLLHRSVSYSVDICMQRESPTCLQFVQQSTKRELRIESGLMEVAAGPLPASACKLLSIVISIWETQPCSADL
jgi:hypothetical protein